MTPRRLAARDGRGAGWVDARDGALAGGLTSAGVALALVFPLARRLHRCDIGAESRAAQEAPMKKTRKPTVTCLETLTREEARAYLGYYGEDELDAARAIARDRNRLDGSPDAPDDTEIHHALFLLCRALGRSPRSFDEVRVELRRRVAA